MKNTKNKRGVAIELAIALLAIFFSLCLLLLTMTLATRKLVQDEVKDYKERMAVDQIGEDFLTVFAAKAKNDPEMTDFTFSYYGTSDLQNYGAEMTKNYDGSYTLRVYHKSVTFTKLKVTVEPSDDPEGYRILSWSRVNK